MSSICKHRGHWTSRQTTCLSSIPRQRWPTDSLQTILPAFFLSLPSPTSTWLAIWSETALYKLTLALTMTSIPRQSGPLESQRGHNACPVVPQTEDKSTARPCYRKRTLHDDYASVEVFFSVPFQRFIALLPPSLRHSPLDFACHLSLFTLLPYSLLAVTRARRTKNQAESYLTCE